MKNRGYHRLRVHVITLILVVPAFVVFYEIRNLTEDYHQTIRSAQTRLASYASGLSEHATVTLYSAEIALKYVVDRVQEHGLLEPPDEWKIHELLRDAARGYPQFGSLLMVGCDGKLVANSLEFPVIEVQLSDRDYFRFHLEHESTTEIHISKPVMNRLNGLWRFFMTRRLSKRDGSFGGIAGVALDPAYYDRFYQTIDVGKSGRILLIRIDGRVLMQTPFSPEALEVDYAQRPMLAEHLPSFPWGTYRNPTAGFDSTDRLISYHRLEKYPVVATVSMLVDEILAPWRVRLRNGFINLGILLLLVAGLGSLLWNRLRDLEKVQASLLEKQEELRESQRAMDTLFNNLPGMAYRRSADPDWTLRFASEGAGSLTGYRPAELTQSPQASFFSLIHREDAISARNAVQSALADKRSYRVQYRLISRDQQERWVWDAGTGVWDEAGRVKAMEGFITDVSELRAVEQALRRSEEKYRTLFEEAINGIVLADARTGIVLDCNRAALAILERSKDQVVGKPWQPLSPRQSRDDGTASELQLNPGPPLDKMIETKVITPSGANKEIALKASRVLVEGRELVQCIFRDVTEAKKLESRLQQARKMEAIGTLAGGIAHDFNNVLAAIIGYAELVDLDLPASSKVKPFLQRILRAAQRAKDLVAQILAFSRQEGEELRPVQAAPIVSEALKLMRASLPTTIEIRQSITTGPTVVLANPTQIHQVVMNLCTNAAHAMGKDGGTLEVCLERVDFEEESALPCHDLTPGPFVVLCVRDTGHGMSPDILERIFDPYFTTKGKGLGTGLGLSVVHGIVKRHSGAVTVESEVGKGSTFRVFLPGMDLETQEDAGEASVAPLGSERILFVDDEPAITEVGAAMLRRQGYDVVTSTDSVRALELFRKDPRAFDLVITDMTMPQLTGDRLAEELMKIRPGIPVILCTGYNESVSPHRIDSMGIRRLIHKPIGFQQLTQAVRSVLDDAPPFRDPGAGRSPGKST